MHKLKITKYNKFVKKIKKKAIVENVIAELIDFICCYSQCFIWRSLVKKA